MKPCLVTRTLRQVESRQKVIRVVGLSATLAQTFIGVKQTNAWKQKTDMEEICYDCVVDFVKAGHQVCIRRSFLGYV